MTTVPPGRVSTSDVAVTDSTLMVYIGTRKYLTLEDQKKLATLKPVFSYKAENALARMANHILGGARFGKDPTDSVLDQDCRAWQFDNLYVTDGSFMPTSGGANPTLTIQANALRVADLLKARL